MASRRLPFSPLTVAPPPPPPPPPASQPLNPHEVIALVLEARQKAVEDEEARPAAEPGAGGLKPGITLDLIGKNIPVLPDEVVDILRQGHGVERLALSHNYLRSLPARFSQCTSLRYLAARNNAIEAFPIQICELTSLEFLDLGRNRLKELPPEISKLTALKALSIQENQITTLPTSLAEMPSLQRLRVSGNPIKYPPKEILQIPPQDSSPAEMMPESEVDRLLTDRIKKFLARSLSISSTRSVDTLSETETGDDDSGGNSDIPRLPKRPGGGRFPVRVKGSEAVSSPSSRSPSISRPPPRVSSRRSLSQYSNGYTRRPGIIPLTMVKSSDSLRSAPVLSVTSPDTQGPGSSSSSHSTDTLTVVNSNLSPGGPVMNRFSTHLRGFSYSGGGLNCTNPVSPEDPSLMRPLYVRELSALPVRRYQTQVPDPVLDFARGVLYSIYQIHLGVQTLMSLTNEGGKRSSLEMIFYNTNTYFVELEQAIQDYDLSLGTRGASRDHAPMQRAYATLIQGYTHICTRLTSSVDVLVENGDPRYMRSFLMLVYHSIMELRVAMNSLGSSASTQEAAAAPPDATPPPRRAQPRPSQFQTPPSASSSAAQFQTPPSGSSRGTVKRTSLPKHPMQVQTNIPYRSRNQPVAVAGGLSSASSQLQGLRTPPLSSDSFTSAISSATGSMENRTPDIARPVISSDSDRHFERFFRSLTNLTNLIDQVSPKLDEFFTTNLRIYTNSMNDTITPNRPSLPVSYHHQQQKWEALIYKTAGVVRQADFLRGMLATLRLRDPGLLDDSSPFWTTCRNLFSGWTELGIQIREVLVADKDKAIYNGGMVEGLRMITKGVKDSIALMGEVKRQQQFQHQQMAFGRPGRSNTYGSASPGMFGDNNDLTLRATVSPATTPQSAAMGMGTGMAIPMGMPMGSRAFRKFSSP
ncbi:RAM signaling pathway protein-domain-containing protein [Podospora fimiseda]|uniref:RAM signaling pathway protein-domain-containing protein n=1 Tax=Podospora fimiseda TaxID=252190 RepID=A0AAN7BSY7_9PEZI|nr:RAM signaling pathway protein-domain-containing protein [Podospora fimiseda]